ncbi:RsmB/NOP family class I SAM-dependent RNA methyltransferase [Hyperthermus butylicus]|uniref:tRNA and rRNA cytosine-C5-methylase n=1 Tax=Hyperthermus butylicus (strain DSM 5456 / JCM 9403 / PLM1-5) TaxID=415426 RepID=A2BK62_HYPBU|nr:RsmB/NOP family class I SAM-dependent RNA methyltransferase [Hyperthermus butylicus]ABM80373.1 tRNA and rRNA cytosine-C5-methylase [Hyperthermus butylicus DSM 5456]
MAASAEELAKMVWEHIEAERSNKPKLSVPAKGLRILVEAVKLAEEFKPSQHAKRVVFHKHGVLGTGLDRLLTSIFYDTMKRMGLLDRVAAELANVPTVLILDPWLRAALRLAVDIVLFHRPDKNTLHRLRWIVADFISAKTHPYVGMFYWQTFDKLLEYRPKPKTVEEALEWKYLLPAWLIRRMRSLLGEEESEKLFEALNKRPLISIRVNTLKTTVEEVVEELKREGKNPIVSTRVPVIVKFEGPYDFDRSRLYREGKFVIQEEASAAASIILDPKPGMTVVDLAAAPGGKTSHIAELMKNHGRIYAFDIDRVRIKRMRMILRRMGITIVRIFEKDAREAPRILGEEIADRVLLDAPCTSTGTIAKNPELRWRVREEGLEEIVKLQREMLEAAAKLVKPGGRLLYTTCSLLPEENEDNIKWFLKRHSEFKLVPLNGPYDPSPLLHGTMRAWPHRHDTIGFFYALLEKKERR